MPLSQNEVEKLKPHIHEWALANIELTGILEPLLKSQISYNELAQEQSAHIEGQIKIIRTVAAEIVRGSHMGLGEVGVAMRHQTFLGIASVEPTTLEHIYKKCAAACEVIGRSDRLKTLLGTQPQKALA